MFWNLTKCSFDVFVCQLSDGLISFQKKISWSEIHVALQIVMDRAVWLKGKNSLKNVLHSSDC